MRTVRRKSDSQTLFRKMRRTILLFTFVPIGILLLIGMPLLYRQQSQKMRDEIKAEMEDQLDRMNNGMSMIELLARSVSTDSNLALEINKAIIQDSMSDYEKFVFSSQTLSTMKVVMSVKQIKAARIFVDFPGIREYTPYLYQMDRAYESGWYEYRDSIPVSGQWYLDVTDQKREVTYSGYYQGDDMAAFVIPGKINSTTASIFEIVLPMQELVPELYTDWKERDFLILDRQGKVHGANPEMPFGAIEPDKWEELLGEDIFRNWGGGIGLYRIWQDFHPIEVAVAQRGGIFLIYTVSMDRPLLLLLGEMGGIVLAGLLLSCLILYAVNRIVKRLLADLDSFTECVREVGQGNLEVEIPKLSQIEVKEVALEYKRMLGNLSGGQGRISPVNQRKMQEAVSYLYRNYARPVDMAEVSNHVSMNYTMFSTEFKKYTGQKFSAWLNRLRIEKAKKLILERELKLNEVGGKVGFEDAARFTKVFREETGMTPSTYREYGMKKGQGN